MSTTSATPPLTPEEKAWAQAKRDWSEDIAAVATSLLAGGLAISPNAALDMSGKIVMDVRRDLADELLNIGIVRTRLRKKGTVPSSRS